ncbi:hypothetical protein M0802_014941, partial [Mischocyttarus mexicanus]
ADFRIDFIDKLKNKLSTIPYDSDHYAISFTIDCCDSTNGIRTQQNLNHKNLSIKEIDSHISKLEEFVVEAIDAVIPKSRPLTNRGCLRYVNNKIRRLHRHKSSLLSCLTKIGSVNRLLRYFKYKEPPSIADLVISKYNNTLLTEDVLNSEDLIEKDNKVFIAGIACKAQCSRELL